MTAKEVFLKRLLEQIEALQTSYDANKNLPESFFENLPTSIVMRTDLPTALAGQRKEKLPSSEVRVNPVDISEYGAAKKLLLSIFEESGKTLQKHELLELFAEKSNKTQEEIYHTVTNGLSSLKEGGDLVGYKPKELGKFRGFFWGLSKWFKNGEPLPQYDAFNDVKELL